MTVVIQINSSAMLTSIRTTCMTSHTFHLLAYFVINFAFTMSINRPLQKGTINDGRLTGRFGIQNFHTVRSTLAHAQMDYELLQFRHLIHENAERCNGDT
jgi:hypothetical protein